MLFGFVHVGMILFPPGSYTVIQAVAHIGILKVSPKITKSSPSELHFGP